MTLRNEDISFKIEQLSQILISKDWQLACAESCTGGWVAKLCTDLAGSSKWFERGYVTYSNRAKHEMLAVENLTLEQHGAVSEAVVKQMAQGACLQAQVAVSLAISGVAGPGGGSASKPVGLVWFAWAINGEVKTYSEIFAGDRNAVRSQATDKAITVLLEYLQEVAS